MTIAETSPESPGNRYSGYDEFVIRNPPVYDTPREAVRASGMFSLSLSLSHRDRKHRSSTDHNQLPSYWALETGTAKRHEY